MRRLLLLVIFLSMTSDLWSQQLGLQAGQTFSKLQFEDSQGNELDNIQSTNSFFMLIEYRAPLFGEQLDGKLYGSAGLSFNGYGSTGSDPALDNFFEWDLAYVGVALGVDYIFYQKGAFATFGSLKASPEFLVRGSQTINNQVFDLVGEEDFDMPIIFFKGGLGVQFEVTSEATIYTQYLIGKSYSLGSSDQELSFITHNVGVGIFLNVLPDNKKKRRRGN